MPRPGKRAFRTQLSIPGEVRSIGMGVVAGDVNPEDDDEEDLLMLWAVADNLIP